MTSNGSASKEGSGTDRQAAGYFLCLLVKHQHASNDAKVGKPQKKDPAVLTPCKNNAMSSAAISPLLPSVQKSSATHTHTKVAKY